MHDAAEAYVGDMGYPLKLALGEEGLRAHRAVERRVTFAICSALDVSMDRMASDVVKAVDRRILLDESAVVLGPKPQEWAIEGGPLGISLREVSAMIDLGMRIHPTNAASRNPPHRGPGRVWTIMAAPRSAFGEAGEGRVVQLLPEVEHLRAVKRGEMTMPMYRAYYLEQLKEDPIESYGPGELFANLRTDSGSDWEKVGDGDTLICCCARSEAAEGRCQTEDAVRAIRAAHKTGLSQRVLGAQFGVCQASIGSIVRGETWGHVQ